MTPGARVAAAIEILDHIQAGTPAEQALTRWARTSRYAGSKDRAAVRDHVFDVLRQKRSAAVLGGAQTGRALMIGHLHASGTSVDALMNGQGHAPSPVSDAERPDDSMSLTQSDRWNLPDWIIPEFERSLGSDAEKVALALQDRAPITLRVNVARLSLAEAQARLEADGVQTQTNTLAPTALTVVDGARKIRTSEAYNTGLVELQDAASQAVVAALQTSGRVLDYCAGGGGKSLALAMDASRQVFAHDAYPARMRDLAFRAGRAEVAITVLEPGAPATHAPFDAVLCDVPCSGSGAWRRNPDGKWVLTPERLVELHALQDEILAQCALLTAPNGVLAYATCSVLRSENEDRVAAFLANHPDWTCMFETRFDVSAEGDGFFTAHLTRV